MMTGALLWSWKHIKQHIPLIKFRKGGPYRENTPAAAFAPASGSKPGPSGTGSNAAGQLPIIEDWQLPSHYRRAKLDEKEINAINSGGAY